MKETVVKTKFLVAVGALDGKLMGIITLHDHKEITDQRFIELVKESYSTYQGEKE